jgi:hypothetical protein
MEGFLTTDYADFTDILSTPIRAIRVIRGYVFRGSFLHAFLFFHKRHDLPEIIQHRFRFRDRLSRQVLRFGQFVASSSESSLSQVTSSL